MAHMSFTLLVLISLFLAFTSEESLANRIYALTDSNIDYYLSQSQYKWFIIFYLSTCGHCTRAREVMTKIHLNVTDDSMRFGEVDIEKNTLSSIRFKAGQVPYIVIIQNGILFELNRFAGEKNIIAFINQEKKMEEAIEMPKAIGYMKLFLMMFSSGVKTTLDTIKGWFRNKKLSNRNVLLAGVIGLIVIVFFEYWFISRFCRKDEEIDDGSVKEESQQSDNDKKNN